MADRYTVNKKALVGLETVAGTPPASVVKELQATSFEAAIAADIRTAGPVGQETDTISQILREWSTTKMTSEIASFTDIIYQLAMWMDKPTPTTPTGGTASREWLFNLTDNIGTFTIDSGDTTAGGADRTSYNMASDFQMEFGKGGISSGGTLFGRRMTTAQTLGTPAAVAQVSFDPGNMDFFLSSGQGGLDGATALPRGFKAMFRMSGRWAPIWPVGSAYSSFGTHVKRKPTLEFGLQMGYADGLALLPIMRLNSTHFARVKCTGPIIEGAINYLYELDCALKVKTAPEVTDLDGLDTLTWTFSIVKDTTWGKALTMRVINGLASL